MLWWQWAACQPRDPTHGPALRAASPELVQHEELWLCQLTAHVGTWHPSAPRAAALLHHSCLHCHSCRDLTAQLCSSAGRDEELPAGAAQQQLLCDTTNQV